jgi:hypothetical protein
MIEIKSCILYILALSDCRSNALSTIRSAASTRLIFTLPRFYEDKMDDAIYPSPLHNIHVRTILSDDEAKACLRISSDFAKATGRWDRPDSDRHASYATCDFAVEDCTILEDYLEKIGFTGRIFDELNEVYGVEQEDMSFLDLFCAHYQTKTDCNQGSMDRLEPHRDGSILSFSITINDPDDFEGGGTLFDGLRDVVSTSSVLKNGGVVRPTRAGDAVFHSGKALHGANAITSGKRTVLVGFVDVAPWCERPGALSAACRDWGRMDVASLRYERQSKKTRSGAKGWILNNSRWMSKKTSKGGAGRSHLEGFSPAFASVESRADKEFQRQKNLETEDKLLRTILLSKPESKINFFGGDVTVL